MTTKDGSAEFKIKSIKDFADAVKQFVAAAVFTGIVTLAQAAIPPDNSNDGSVPSTSWVNKAINAVINSDAFRQHIVVGYLDEQNGFIKFGDWLGNIILQWGYIKTKTSTWITFPISFSNANYVFVGTARGMNSSAQHTYAYTGNSTTAREVRRIHIHGGENAIGREWIAIGI